MILIWDVDACQYFDVDLVRLNAMKGIFVSQTCFELDLSLVYENERWNPRYLNLLKNQLQPQL